MNPAGEVGLAARQVVARGTQVAGLAVSSARTALFSDVGHLSLPVDPRAVQLVAGTLAQLDGSPSADLTVGLAAADVIGPSPTSAS
jgi:hypothetical protein